jgi:phosphoglycerate dehydrogenase-like enzyme
MEPLPKDVELVAKPDPEVEFLLLSAEFSGDVPAVFRRLPGLKVVQTFSAGVDRLLPLIPPGVVLCSAVGVHDVAVSEWVVAVILAMNRRLPDFLERQRRGEWNRDLAEPGDFSNHPLEDLEGKTVLVVGHGSIGSAVAQRLAPFGVRVVGVAQHAREGVQPPDALPGLLPEADVVVNLLPSTPETEKFVDSAFLGRMKSGALFVNAGRGKTVDTDALIESLRAGHVRAALDVTDPEPLPAGHPLWQAPNVLITPHVAGTVNRWEARAYRFAGEQIRRYAAGQPLAGVRTGNMPVGRGLAD